MLLRDLPNLILSTCEPSRLSDEQLESVAGESEEAKEQRIKAVQRVSALEAVMQTCRQYRGTNRSTPQKVMPCRSEIATRTDSPATKVATVHVNGAQAELFNELSTNKEIDHDGFHVNIESPATPKPARSPSQPQNGLFPPSPSSGLSSGYRSAKSNESLGTQLSSPRSSSSSGQNYNNATGSIAYRSGSRSGKHGKSPA